jgi:hypothetical protein
MRESSPPDSFATSASADQSFCQRSPSSRYRNRKICPTGNDTSAGRSGPASTRCRHKLAAPTVSSGLRARVVASVVASIEVAPPECQSQDGPRD